MIAVNPETSGKARENRARRWAQRQGLELLKSKLRDPRAIGFGGFMLVKAGTERPVAGHKPHAYSWSLEQVEQYLRGEEQP